jgi:ABC-type Fe3+/spermidine/putrescine transport system ATPase subunit
VRLDAAPVFWPVRLAAPATGGERVEICVRPEAVRFDDPGSLSGVVDERRFLGASWIYGVQLDGSATRLEVTGEPGLEPGGTVRVGLRREADLPIAFLAAVSP